MSDYTLNLSTCKPGDIVAFQCVGPGRTDGRKLVLYRSSHSAWIGYGGRDCDVSMLLDPIDPRRLTLDGEPCVKERFRVLYSSDLGWCVWDNRGHFRIATFFTESDARSYADGRNRSEQ